METHSIPSNEKFKLERHDPKVIVEFPRFIFNCIIDQIKQADTKAVGVLSILGIITSALMSRLNALKGMLGLDHPLWVILFSVSVIMILLSMKFIIRVVYPRDSKSKDKTMIYFKDIANHSSVNEYIDKGSRLVPEDMARETYSNVYYLARIATQKYAALRQAMVLTIITLIWTIGVLLLS